MSRHERPNCETKFEVKRSQGFACAVDGIIFDEHDLVIHHNRPLAQGGTNDKENLVAIHKDRHPEVDKLAFDENIYLTELFNRTEVGEIVVFLRNPNINYHKYFTDFNE